MKQTYKPLKMRVVRRSEQDVLTASAENTDMPYLTDIYGESDWLE